MKLCFRNVDIDTWNDFARLFEERGGPKNCWCMVWRASTEEAKQRDGASRRAQIEKRVCDRAPIGLLGYLDDRPVTWCSIAPRDTYRNIGGLVGEPNDHIWSLACMFIQRKFRKMGLVPQIIQAAVAHAKARGATIVEAYPVDRDSPSFRFMGFVDMFEAAGFTEIRRTGQRRHVLRLKL